MKANYKNWVPKGMLAGFACGALVSLFLFLIFGKSPLISDEGVK